jgi:hypothetical protein
MWEGTHKTTVMSNKMFWEELVAYFPLIPHRTRCAQLMYSLPQERVYKVVV